VGPGSKDRYALKGSVKAATTYALNALIAYTWMNIMAKRTI